MMQDNPPPRPELRDWALLAIGVAFVLMGLIILPSNLNVGIVTLAFFGPCAALFVWIIIRKLRARRPLPLKVEITGGVPIRQSVTHILLSGGTLLLMGAVLVVFGRSYGIVFWSLSWVMALAGGAVLLARALGWLGTGYIQFEPNGITIGQRGWAYTAPWDQVTEVHEAEYHSNPLLLIWLADLGSLTVAPPQARARVLANLMSSSRNLGAPIAIMTSQYSLDLPLLSAAVRRYASNPSARAELAQRLLTHDARS